MHAIVAGARCTHATHVPDIDGIDMTITHQVSGPEPWFAGLDVQLKANRKPADLKETHVAQSLKRDHYNKLRTPKLTNPRILIVIVLPHEIEDWLEQSEERLALFRCAYWLSLKGMPAVETESTTVHVPRANVFSIDALCKLMYRVRAGLELGG